MERARIVTLDARGLALDEADLRFERGPGPVALVPLASAAPAAFARAYVSAWNNGFAPIVLNPELPEQPRTALLASIGGAIPRAVGHVLCTSGSTRSAGVPRGFFFSGDAALANARAHTASIGMRPRGSDTAGDCERVLLPLPIWHSFGVVAGMLGTAVCGGDLYGFTAAPDPHTLLAVLDAYAITTLYLNPTLARLLVRSAERHRPPRLPALSRISIGSAGITRGELAQLMKLFPDVEYFFTYGLTEMGPRVTTFAAGTHRAPSAMLATEPDRAAPIGRPLEGVSLSLDEGGAHSCFVIDSPYAATWEAVDGEATPLPQGPGGFVTADAAELLPSGDYEIKGRVDEVILTGGVNVHPESIERIALSVPGVAHACAGGLPSNLYGTVVVLFCERAPGSDPRAVEVAVGNALEAALPPTHRPRQIRFVDALPRTGAGKVLRREVLARFGGGK
jgi:2-furoate---CoA ligase